MFNAVLSLIGGAGLRPPAHRNHPFNESAYGSKPAAHGSGQPRRVDAYAAASRLCLSAVPLSGWGGRGRVA